MLRRRIIFAPARDKPFPLAALIAAAALYAAVELAAALAAGFFLWGRAEALLFLALRPWLLLIAPFLVARYPAADRLLFYAAALFLAAASETLLLLGLGASDPWPQMLRGLAGGAALLLLFEIVFQLGRRVLGRWGRAILALALAFLFLTPFGLRGYDLIVLGSTERKAAEVRPDLMLMTALPIIWGEKGAFDPASRPAEAYTALQREFRVRPLDVLDKASLGSGRLLLLAQPRALAPEELVELDDWVRRGGRALIMTDPALVWPTELALGDSRRPPPIGLLDPILTHWGIRVDPPADRALAVEERASRRLAMAAPGTVTTTNPNCRVEPDRHLARCRIGKGEVILLADADLLHDSLWAAPGDAGAQRHQRRADNPLVVADLLDELAGIGRARADGDVQWISHNAPRGRALLLAALPLLAAFGFAGAIRLRRRR
ncbi:MAG TPA: DUF4350 domain-containing protein [Allosphingosinicella sp.]|nr:DUF4350 domain-containing protein [Allosphingosinicella sp.]